MNQVQVTFRNMPGSDAIEALVQEKAAWLQRFFPRIQSCHVVVAMSAHRHGKGTVYHVRVDVIVPGAELVANHDPAATPHEDAYVAIRDAFDVMRRQLQDYAHKLRGETKSRVSPPHGRVARFFPQQGYGFIETADGREVYFHENSVLDGGFQRLEVGDEVRFEEEQGLEGPQASTVAVMR